MDDINRSKYTVPEGWDTRDQVAASLQCDPNRVNDLLKPGIQAGDIERQEFPVWDDKRRMTVRVMCYRLAGEKQPPKEKPEKASPDFSMERKIREAIKKYPRKTNREIAKCIYKCTSAMVQAVREGGTL